MRIALSTPFRKGAFLIGCVAVMLLAWALCCQAIAAQWLANGSTPQSLARAARVQPLNGEYEGKIGLLFMDPSYADFNGAVSHLERAAALNPHSSAIWLNLASAYEVTGDQQRRSDAIRHAMVSEPKDTQVQWEAANLFIASDTDRSLDLLRGVIENDPQYALPAIRIAFHATNNDIGKAMRAIPATPVARLQLIRWLLDHQEADAADRVWPTLLSAPGVLPIRDTFFYLDSLVARHQVAQARDAWSALARKDPGLRGRTSSDNLVCNGDFEEDLLNGGFGWRYVPTLGVTASLDTSTFHGGTRSMVLQIDGEDLQDSGLSELIAVDAGGHYRLSVWLHAEELDAAHGIRLAITDAYSNAQLLMTDESLGSFPWREVSGDFVAPADTQLVKLAIIRSPGNGRIRGKLWVDDLRIDKK